MVQSSESFHSTLELRPVLKNDPKGRPITGTRILYCQDGLVNKDCAMLPIIHIDVLAEDLTVTRDWINRNWLKGDDPPPCFRDGDSVFFEIVSLQEWARRRGYGFTDTDIDPMD